MRALHMLLIKAIIDETTIGTGGPTMYSSPPPNFLTVVFKKQEISGQVVTRMQDLASEFWKIFRVIPPDPHSRRGRPPPSPNTQPGLPGPGRKRPGVGIQTFVPSTFQPWLRPWRQLAYLLTCFLSSCLYFVNVNLLACYSRRPLKTPALSLNDQRWSRPWTEHSWIKIMPKHTPRSSFKWSTYVIFHFNLTFSLRSFGEVFEAPEHSLTNNSQNSIDK